MCLVFEALVILYFTWIIKHQTAPMGLLTVCSLWSAEKEFDVFLSFVWPRTSSQSAPGTEQEGKRSTCISPSHGVAWILTFHTSSLLWIKPAQLWDEQFHSPITGGAVAPGVRGGVGSSPLPPGEGRASRGRSDDRSSLFYVHLCSLRLIVSIVLQPTPTMWSSLSRGAKCWSVSCRLSISPTPMLFSSWNLDSR